MFLLAYSLFCLCSLGICLPLLVFLSPKMLKTERRGEVYLTPLQAPSYAWTSMITGLLFLIVLLEVHFQVQTFGP